MGPRRHPRQRVQHPLEVAHKLLQERPEPRLPALHAEAQVVDAEVAVHAVVLLPFPPDRLLGFLTVNRISADTGPNPTPTIWRLEPLM